MTFYRKLYWYRTHTTMTACEPVEANFVQIVMPGTYGFQASIYEAEFTLPVDQYAMDKFVGNLERAYELGKAAKAAEVAVVLNKLIDPR